MTMPKYYDCGICGHFHPWEFDGDCRNDNRRFTAEELDAKHGPNKWEECTWEERLDADSVQAVAQDGEHLFKDLVRAILQSGCLAADDNVETTGGVIQTAIYVIDRMKDELDTARSRRF